MQKINTLVNIEESTKGQKIIAAIYLVTNHLSDTDPIRTTLRSDGISLVSTKHSDRAHVAERINNILGAANLARIINEKNVLIISNEIKNFCRIGSDEILGKLFDDGPHHHNTEKNRMSYMSDSMSLKEKSTKHDAIFVNKNKRQNEILSFINDRKAAGIKDIAILFPDISEKTIQRELSLLVDQGKITKRGSKRWSIYMTVAQS